MRLRAHQKYAPSGSNDIGDVPAHWAVKRARYCADVNPHSIRMRVLNPDHEISVVPMDAVGEHGGLRLEQTKAVSELGTSYTEFDDGDVIVAKITPCFENGKGALASGLTSGTAIGTTELHVMRARDGLDRRFLFYFTISHSFRRGGEAEMYGAGGQKRVPPEFCKNVHLPLPPEQEQRAIAGFLDRETAKVDALVAKKRTLIERLKEKRTALISRTVTRGLPPAAARAVGLDPHPKLKPSGITWLGDTPTNWEVSQLRRKCVILDCMHRTVPFVDEGVPLASIREVHGFEVDLSEAKHTTEDEYLSLIEGGRRPCVGDVIYSRNATVGDAAIVTTRAPFAMGQDVCLLRSEEYPRFLLYLLKSDCLVQQMEARMVGATFRRINVGQIRVFWACWPPVDEQRLIAEFLDRATSKFDAMSARVEAAADRLLEYRTAMISAAVTGKIKVWEVV